MLQKDTTWVQLPGEKCVRDCNARCVTGAAVPDKTIMRNRENLIRSYTQRKVHTSRGRELIITITTNSIQVRGTIHLSQGRAWAQLCASVAQAPNESAHFARAYPVRNKPECRLHTGQRPATYWPHAYAYRTCVLCVCHLFCTYFGQQK